VRPVNWYLSLPPAQTLVPCGNGTHPVTWNAGRLELPAHRDAEAERVLAALGGDKPRCLDVAQAWDEHADDLDVLMTGPRSRADAVTVGWDQAEEHQASWFGLPPGMSLPASTRQPGRSIGRTGPHRKAPRLPEELLQRVQARIEVLRLLALGPAFQFRLAGTVTAAWAAASHAEQHASHQPELTAALTGRAAPVVAQWLDIPPEAVMVTPAAPDTTDCGPTRPPAHSATPGDSTAGRPSAWGSLEVRGTGTNRLVRASLPVGWLASVWACGFALVDGHLVVAVEEPGWPRARVLALPKPGAAPVSLDLTGTDDAPVPHWALSSPG